MIDFDQNSHKAGSIYFPKMRILHTRLPFYSPTIKLSCLNAVDSENHPQVGDNLREAIFTPLFLLKPHIALPVADFLRVPTSAWELMHYRRKGIYQKEVGISYSFIFETFGEARSAEYDIIAAGKLGFRL